jgi:hypothetical protein
MCGRTQREDEIAWRLYLRHQAAGKIVVKVTKLSREPSITPVALRRQLVPSSGYS